MTHLRCIKAAVSGETRMTMTLKTIASLLTAATLLTGCSSMNVFKDDSPPPPEPDLPPEEPVMMAPQAAPKGPSAAEISKRISGKSWKWSSPNYSGVTLYANDGSSLIELKDKVKGNLAPVTTTGRWRAENGMLCESVKAAPPVLTADVEEKCKPFSSSTPNAFAVGKANFVLDN
jgi:hypothetical protein